MESRTQRFHYLFVVLSLLGLSSAILLVFYKPTPSGFWVNVYTYFALAWLLVGGVAVSGILYTSHRSLSWSIVWMISVMLVFAAGSIALIWGVPWPNHDPWTHLGIIKFGYLGPYLNPYPAFHVLVTVLAKSTGLSSIHWITVASVLFPTLATGFVIALVRRLPVSPTTSQPALFVLLPGIFLGFTPRPFTLAWIFVPIAFFLVFRLNKTHSKKYRDLTIGLVVISPVFHPQLTGFLIILLSGTWLTSRLQERLPVIEIIPENPVAIHYGLILIGGLIFVSYIIFYSTVGLALIQGTIQAYLIQSGPKTLEQASTGSGPFAFLESPRAAQEALIRLSYILLLGVIVAIGIIRKLVQRRVSFEFVITWVVSAGIIFGFFTLFVFSSNLGIERILRIIPLIAIPIVVLGLKQLPKQVMPIALAILCLTAGLLTVYGSEFQGGAGISANNKQAAGAEWLSDYNNDRKIIGSSSTYWMLKAYVPRQQLWDWRYRGQIPEDTRFRWQIRGKPTLYVTDGTTEARIEQIIEEEGQIQYVTEYNRLSKVRDKIYTNDGLSVYQNGTNDHAN